MTGPTVDDRIEDAAAHWVARVDAGDWSAEDEAALEIWLDGDVRHRGAFLKAQALWASVARTPMAEMPVVRPWHAGRFGRRTFLAGAGALTATAASVALLWDDRLHYTTGVGEIRRVPMSDGSTAAINTASSVAFAIDAKRRDVNLDRGEVWFQVAKDASRPFVVAAGRVRARAVGTAFAVRRRGGGADILVTEGVVEAWADGAEGHRVRLTAGQRAFVSDDAAIQAVPGSPSAVDRTLAWRGGKVDLNGETLNAAIAEFNRYNRRQLRIADPRLAGEILDGVFRTDDPEGFARAVGATFGASVDYSGRDEIRIGSVK